MNQVKTKMKRGSGYLSEKNKHELDKNILFNEDDHVYYVLGDPTFIVPTDDREDKVTLNCQMTSPGEILIYHKVSQSVTQIIKSSVFPEDFDADKVVNQYYSCWKYRADQPGYYQFIKCLSLVFEMNDSDIKDAIILTWNKCNYNHRMQKNIGSIENKTYTEWKTNKEPGYYLLMQFLSLVRKMKDDQIKQSIKKSWELNGKEAMSFGNYMHRQFELCVNKEDFDSGLPEYVQFCEFFYVHLREKIPHYEFYRTEWGIFDRDTWIAGQIDLVIKDSTTCEYILIDYKRCNTPIQKVFQKNKFTKFGKYPFDTFPSTNYYKYSLQLNIYNWILAKNYGITVSKMFLLQFYGSKKYNILDVPNLQSKVSEFMDEIVAKRSQNSRDMVTKSPGGVDDCTMITSMFQNLMK